MKNKKFNVRIEDIIYICILSLIFLGGLLKPHINPKSINYDENRTAYSIPIFYVQDFVKKSISR